MSLRGLLVALGFLTRLPVPAAGEVPPADFARGAPWFPLVGALIGAAVALALWVGAHASPWVGALLALAVWVLITGALHLDGLGDVADGLGAAHASPEGFLEAARDPHAGNFAIIAIALQLVAKLVLLAEVSKAVPLVALVLIPAWARWGAIALARTVPPLGHGLGARFAHADVKPAVEIWAFALGVLALWTAPALLGALLIVPLVGLYWKRRLGGMSGDCHGAGIEVTETALLLLLVIFQG